MDLLRFLLAMAFAAIGFGANVALIIIAYRSLKHVCGRENLPFRVFMLAHPTWQWRLMFNGAVYAREAGLGRARSRAMLGLTIGFLGFAALVAVELVLDYQRRN